MCATDGALVTNLQIFVQQKQAHHQTVHLHNAQDHCPTAQPLFPTAVDVTLASCQLTVELHPLSALERCHWMICKQD